jgi:hypothetical protein
VLLQNRALRSSRPHSLRMPAFSLAALDLGFRNGTQSVGERHAVLRKMSAQCSCRTERYEAADPTPYECLRSRLPLSTSVFVTGHVYWRAPCGVTKNERAVLLQNRALRSGRPHSLRMPVGHPLIPRRAGTRGTQDRLSFDPRSALYHRRMGFLLLIQSGERGRNDTGNPCASKLCPLAQACGMPKSTDALFSSADEGG